MVFTLGKSGSDQQGKQGKSKTCPSPLLSLPLPERVATAEFLPLGDANLLAMGLRSKLVLLKLAFNDDATALLDAAIVKEVNHDDRIHAIAWDPNTADMLCKGAVRLATGSRRELRLFTLTTSTVAEAGVSGSSSDEVRVFPSAHRDYINSVAFQPWTGELLASGSDDCSVHVHSAESGKRVHAITFASPVMALRWHPAEAEAAKMLAAEKAGRMHLFNMVSFTPILSFDVSLPLGPLLSADWSLSDSSFVLATAGSELLVWNLTSPSAPVMRKTLHDGQGVRSARFAAVTESLIATVGKPCHAVRVFNAAASHDVLRVDSLATSAVAWHPKMELIVIGQDERVDFYRTGQK